MYAWIWRKLPFGLPGKIVGSLALAAATGFLLWYVVFPWAQPLLPFDDVQVTQNVDDSGDSGDPGVTGNDPAPDGGNEDDNSVPYPTHTNNPEPTRR
jgi:hypothetical protein